VASFEEARTYGGNFCLATHYWEFDDHMRSALRHLLDYAARYPEVCFVPANALFDTETGAWQGRVPRLTGDVRNAETG
jgi:hypothetical protein